MIAGVGIGNMYINIVGYSVIVGLNNGLSTYVSQCNDQGNLQLCGIYLNRERLIALLAQIPIQIVLSQAEPVFLIMQIDPLVAREA